MSALDCTYQRLLHGRTRRRSAHSQPRSTGRSQSTETSRSLGARTCPSASGAGLEAQMLPRVPYRERVDAGTATRGGHGHCPRPHLGRGQRALRNERSLDSRSWSSSLASCVSAIDLAVADTFCGSGQIPFEAARLGCDVYASDLNPIACMLTWGAFNIVGGSIESRDEARPRIRRSLVDRVQEEIDRLRHRRRRARLAKPRSSCIALKPAVHRPAGWFPCYPRGW